MGNVEKKDLGVPAGAGPIEPLQSPPAAWTAEALVTAWQAVFESIEAHIQDRMEMRDPASPETYLAIIRADKTDVHRYSTQIVNARWADYCRYRKEVERLLAERVSLVEAAAVIVERYSLPTIQSPSMGLIDKAAIAAEIRALTATAKES